MIRLRCKRWDCPTCCRKKGAKICRRFKESGLDTVLTRLLTLPFALSGDRDWETAMRESGVILNRFLTRLRSTFPRLRYFWTREVGKKSNMVHFHVLVDRYLPKPFLIAAWRAAGGGSVVDIGVVRSSAKYAFKYLTKVADYPPEVQRSLYKKRRYSSSYKLLAPCVVDKLIGDWVYLSDAQGCNMISSQTWRSSDGIIFERDKSGYP